VVVGTTTTSTRSSSMPRVVVLRTMATTPKDAVDPMEVFDEIDLDHNGTIDRDEFKKAVEKMNYQDLLRIKAAVSRNELSYNPKADPEKSLTETQASVFGRRLIVTAEVAVSKIFPAGFGWQTAATLADTAGLQATDASFFLSTGLGDGLGVCTGHFLYMAGKKMVTGDDSIDMTAQLQTGVWLGSAAVFSGTAWQPTVNALQAAEWSFGPAMVATGAVGTAAFYTGLRVFRKLYSPIMAGVEEATYANLKADAALSVAVGGAAGAFLGTDLSYGATASILQPIVGIPETAAATTASMLAGSSTAIGFTAVQMVENAMYPKDKCWVD